MRWPWSRKRRKGDEDSTEARKKADRDLAAANARWPEVRRVSGSLRELRQRNHFGQSVALIFRDEGDR